MTIKGKTKALGGFGSHKLSGLLSSSSLQSMLAPQAGLNTYTSSPTTANTSSTTGTAAESTVNGDGASASSGESEMMTSNSNIKSDNTTTDDSVSDSVSNHFSTNSNETKEGQTEEDEIVDHDEEDGVVVTGGYEGNDLPPHIDPTDKKAVIMHYQQEFEQWKKDNYPSLSSVSSFSSSSSSEGDEEDEKDFYFEEDEYDEEDDEDGVHYVITHKLNKKGNVMFLVRWKQLGPEDDYWVSMTEMSECYPNALAHYCQSLVAISHEQHTSSHLCHNQQI